MENDGSFVPQSYGADISWIIIFGMYSVYQIWLLVRIKFGLVSEGNWYWHERYLTMEKDGSFVPQVYVVDFSWSNIFRNVFCGLLVRIKFGLVFEGNCYGHEIYLSIENDGSFVPQSYGVDISWIIIFGMDSVDYLSVSNLVRFLKVTGIDTRDI